jgi:hypothetical protein
MRKYAKVILSLFLFSPTLLVFAQDVQNGETPTANANPSLKPPKQTKVYNLDFEDELVEGGVQKPDLFYLIQRKNFNYRKLVRLRENFLPEMKETSEHLLEVGGNN